tara:strand:- start:1982 stop:2227 length:246 start_codon:yes stop_codon:yes gene_type:complete
MQQVFGMTLADVLAVLREEGFANAVPGRIHYAITNGKISRPHVSRAHRYVFTEANIEELRSYLANVPKPGRKPKEPELATG